VNAQTSVFHPQPTVKRYGDKAEEQSAARAEYLTCEGDHKAPAIWRRHRRRRRLPGAHDG
jgi:hypothetical protein